ncbi:hypothetical protein OAA86_00095 [Rhodospirillales bacterium]|nr:hypothetical protein [Rhodospirillales bacterium]
MENAFNTIYPMWRDNALVLQSQSTADLAHMPTMSTYASDFGVMLAWLVVVENLAASDDAIWIGCDDPWLYRALALLPGVTPIKVPRISIKWFQLILRGYLARTLAAMRVALAKWKTRQHRKTMLLSIDCILVYGHPESSPDGNDAYFSNLLNDIPALQRIMHTDCDASFALTLAKGKRTFSLHAWGHILTILKLPFAKWRPDTQHLEPKIAWLVKRAAVLEGSGGSAAMTKWQMSCQESWLRETQPKSVSWPWENHPWERDFVRQTRKLGVKTFGYQHTVVGRHMFNQGADANVDGTNSLPDKILLNGPCYRDDLALRGIPHDMMEEIGSHRIGDKKLPRYGKDGVVFLALSNNPLFAMQMIDATRSLACEGMPFLVKDHPLSPYSFDDSPYFTHTQLPLDQLPPLRALIYCTGTTGLEGLLAQIPTIRFTPNGGIALDILPQSMQVTSVAASELAAAMEVLTVSEAMNTEELFPPPNVEKWRALFSST